MSPPSGLSRLAHRLAVRDRIGRWWQGPDRPAARVVGSVVQAVLLASAFVLLRSQDATQYATVGAHPAYWWIVFVLAVAGLLIVAFEMPPRWPSTVLHLVNSVYFAVLPLLLFHLQTDYYSPGSSDGSSAILEGTFVGGTVGYAIAAVGCGVTVLRRARDAVTITGMITAVLAAVGTALIAVSEIHDPVDLSTPGCGILLLAAASSLVMAGLLVRSRLGSRPG